MDLIAASLIAALVKYQLPLAAGLGTWFTYLASKRTWFQQLGDWGKKAVVAVAAFVVVLGINAVGGQVSADLQGLVDGVLAALLGGGVAAAPVALAYRFGRVQVSAQGTNYPPGASRRGSATLGGMLAIALLVGLAACVPSPAVAMPAPFAPLMLVADTVRITAAPCDADEPTVACRVAVTGTVGQTAITFPAVADVVVGGTATVSASVVCTALQQVSVTVTSRGVNRSGELSAPRTATATAVCPDGAPNVPRSFTVTITVVRP